MTAQLSLGDDAFRDIVNAATGGSLDADFAPAPSPEIRERHGYIGPPPIEIRSPCPVCHADPWTSCAPGCEANRHPF